jgi:hypothetical protein
LQRFLGTAEKIRIIIDNEYSLRNFFHFITEPFLGFQNSGLARTVSLSFSERLLLNFADALPQRSLLPD